MMEELLKNSKYVLNPVSQIWSRPGYGGISYNDGDEIEQRIASIIESAQDKSVLSTELRQYCTDWPSQYHLSGTRANILRPFVDSLKGDVLEIGAGCGAITRFLGECSANVIALEGSPRRAAIARSRTSGLENVSVLAERFSSFQTDKRFDVITLIGVLEYANMFTPSEHPALAMLQQIRTLLKPSGKLIIAIENQLGLKYFAGAPEDHLGKVMYGVEGRYQNNQPQTFGKRVLNELLQQADFNNTNFIASYPDYKLPVSFVTEKGMNTPAFDSCAFAWQSARRDPQLPAHTNFSMELVWPEIFKNGISMDLSNSFLVIASPEEQNLLNNEDEILAFHYSTSRVPQYCKETRFVLKEKKKIEIDYSRLSKAVDKNKSDSIIDFNCPMTTAYSTGKPMSWEFIEIVTRDGWSISAVGEYLKKYISVLDYLLKRSESGIALNTLNAKLPSTFVDVIPQNIIIENDGTPVMIDNEWILKDEVKLGHLLFRSLFSMIGLATKFGKHYDNKVYTWIEFIAEAIKMAGFNVLEKNIEEWKEIELKIQQETSGQNLNEFFEQWPDRQIEVKDLSQALNKVIDEKENHIQNISGVIGKKDESITNLNQSLYKKDESITNLNQSLNKKEEEIKNLEQSLAEKNHTINLIVASKSWRLTKPLRAINKSAEKIKKLTLLSKKTVKESGGFIPVCRKALKLWRLEGLAGLSRGLRYVTVGGVTPTAISISDYAEWITQYDTVEKEEVLLGIKQMSNHPLLSVIMPVYNPKLAWLEAAIKSLKSQTYRNWELCIADDKSSNSDVIIYLKEQQAADERIKVVFRQKNGHISAASNSALEIASGEWIVLMDQDDLLPEHALYFMAKAVNENPEAGLIYSDEDKVDEVGNRHSPYFKSDWNRSLFYSQNMICHLGAYRKSLIDQVGGVQEGLEGAQDHDLALKVIELLKDEAIVHIPKILYHWRVHSQSTAGGADAKPYAAIAGEKAIKAHLERSCIKADVTSTQYGYRVKYSLPDILPKVSLIIPTRNGHDLVKMCIESIISKTTYPNYEIILIDNGSDDPESLEYFSKLETNYDKITIKRDESPFNYSALNNDAVKVAKGDIIGLVNNDIEVIEPEWLSEMVSQVIQQGVGAVGAKLLYPTGLVQHPGVVIGIGGVAGHVFHNMHPNDPGYFGRLNLVNEYSAVTAACLLVKKEDYEEVGGLNENDLKIAFNDVDLCLKLKELGLRNIYTPYALLYHHESASRGYEDNPEKIARFNSEIHYMKSKWGKYIKHDPCYNPNLTLEHSDFSLAWPPRVRI